MDNAPNNEQGTPAADGGKQTPINPKQRTTGQTTKQDTKSADPEAPGAGSNVPGSPNQGTDAR